VYVIIFLFLVLLAGTQTCTIPAPGPGWVCQDGGWLPPGHPLIRPPTPAPPAPPDSLNTPSPILFGASTPVWPPAPTEPGPNASIIEAAKRGIDLPPGDVYFTPPLRLRDIARLRGTAGRTVLKPNTPAGGPLVIIETTSAGDYAIEYPIRQIVEGIRIACLNEYQTGIYINGGVMTLQDVTVVGCGEGLYVSFGVNIAVRDSLFVKNRVALMLLGQGPPRPSITTVRFSGCRIRGSTMYGARIGHGLGIVFDDSTIFEGNSGTALHVEPAWPQSGISVLLRDVWFEANGTDITDPRSLVTIEGLRQRYGHVRSGAHRAAANPWTRSQQATQAQPSTRRKRG